MFCAGGKTGNQRNLCRTRSYRSPSGPVVDRIIAKMAGEDITVVLPRHAFCRGSFCETRLNGNILYYDDDRLSVAGSKVARLLIMAALRKHI